MGWASGSELAESIWHIVKSKILKKDRKEVANKLIDAFEDFDCDTIYEVEDLWKASERGEDDYDMNEKS